MQNDNYVWDRKRDMMFGDPNEAAAWYEARLTEAQAALTELMEVLPQLVEISENYGISTAEDLEAIAKAKVYIDIYEGRLDAPADDPV